MDQEYHQCPLFANLDDGFRSVTPMSIQEIDLSTATSFSEVTKDDQLFRCAPLVVQQASLLLTAAGT